MSDHKEAEDNATFANNWVANEVKKHPDRFDAFCTLSMHNPQQAANELVRCVKELGMLGALINDHQSMDQTERASYSTMVPSGIFFGQRWKN